VEPRGGQPEEKIPEFGAITPLGRPGQPAELAGVYVLLASEDSSYAMSLQPVFQRVQRRPELGEFRRVNMEIDETREQHLVPDEGCQSSGASKLRQARVISGDQGFDLAGPALVEDDQGVGQRFN
jgi:hypothetical protein